MCGVSVLSIDIVPGADYSMAGIVTQYPIHRNWMKNGLDLWYNGFVHKSLYANAAIFYRDGGNFISPA
jgi:hypothetical protein